MQGRCVARFGGVRAARTVSAPPEV